MYRGGQTNTGSPHVGQHPHVIGACQRGNFPALRKSAGIADVRLHDIQPPFLDEAAKRPPALERLATRDAHA